VHNLCVPEAPKLGGRVVEWAVVGWLCHQPEPLLRTFPRATAHSLCHWCYCPSGCLSPSQAHPTPPNSLTTLYGIHLQMVSPASATYKGLLAVTGHRVREVMQQPHVFAQETTSLSYPAFCNYRPKRLLATPTLQARTNHWPRLLEAVHLSRCPAVHRNQPSLVTGPSSVAAHCTVNRKACIIFKIVGNVLLVCHHPVTAD
jgi:hypothetical protein